MTKSKNNSKRTRRPQVVIAVLLAIITPIIAGLFFNDYRGVPFGWFITFIWYLAILGAFVTFLLYYALFVLPPHEGEYWWEGVRLIWRNITNPLNIPDGASRHAKAPYPGANTLPLSFKYLKAGILRSHQALAIGKGNHFERAAGPGYVRLRRGERIIQVIDLRKHRRSAKTNAITRDGISVEVNATVNFHVRRLENLMAGEKRPYTYDPNAIFEAAQLTSFDDQDKPTVWSEQIAPQAASYFANAVSIYDLNTLLQNPRILGDANENIQRELAAHFGAMGVEINTLRGTVVDYPSEILDQRLNTWRAPHQSRIQIVRAAGEAEEMRRMKRARARAQIEIIQNIIQNIDEMRRAGHANLTEVVTLRMIEALEDAMASNRLQTILPERILAALVMETQGQIRNLLPPVADKNNNEDEP